MRKAIGFSLVFHVTVVAAGYAGIPALRSPQVLTDTPIIVGIVTLSDKTNAPKLQEKPKKNPKKKAKPKPKAAKPKPPPPPPPPPKAAPPPPEPEVAELVPEAKPKPKPVVKPKPKIKVKPKSKPKTSRVLAKAQPRRKPKPPNAMDMIQKALLDVEKRKPSVAVKPEKKKEKKKDEYDLMQIAKAISTTRNSFDPSLQVSATAIDIVRRQIMECWVVPAGAKGAENLAVSTRVFMNPDGYVRQAQILDKMRLGSDPVFRSAAESALRAVLNKRCQPFKLPREQFNRWNTMKLTFDPKEMF